MTEIKTLSEKVESDNLFTVSVTYESDSLRQVLTQILQKVQKNSNDIVSLSEGRIPASVSDDQDIKTRLANIEKRLIDLERKQVTPTVDSDPYFMPLTGFEESKELSMEEVMRMIKNLKYETDQRVSKLNQEIKQLSLNSKQPFISTEKEGGSAFEYNRSKLFA